MYSQQGGIRKAGLILRETAKDYLIGQSYTENEVQKIVERGDLNEIERLTGAISILDAVIHKLCPVLAFRDRIMPPKYLFNTLMYSEEPRKELEGFLRQIERCSEPRKAELIMLMLNSAHDEWVKLHDDWFFKSDMQDAQCLFMPLELIGFEATKRYFTYIERVVDLFGWIVDEKLLLIAYRVVQDGFCLENQICTDEQLITYLTNARYEALSPRIKKALKGNTELARRMVYS